MILPMKKVTLLCLEKDRAISLERLRSLGLMQLVPAPVPDAGDAAALAESVASIDKALGAIRAAASADDEKEEAASRSERKDADGASVVRRANELTELSASLQKELDALYRTFDLLEPWGDFSRASLDAVREKGVFITFCASSPRVFRNRTEGTGSSPAFPEGTSVHVISRSSRKVCYVLISTVPPEQPDPESVVLPEETLADVRARLTDVRARLDAAGKELRSLRGSLDAVSEFRIRQAAELEFVSARDGMSKSGAIVYLQGFVPEPDMPRLRAAALEYGWALLEEDPVKGEFVPTCIRKPKILNIMDPLFDFIGVQPGYDESDVNVFFLLFFPVFFGMIIGDAGYGILFLAAAFFFKRKLRDNPSARLPLNLFILLSSASLIWGVLNGSWIGIPKNILPGFLSGWSLLSDPEHNAFACRLAENLHLVTPDMTEAQRSAAFAGMPDKFVQYFCFLLAALHLGSARLFKFLDEIGTRWTAVEHIGWGFLIIANFFTAVELIVFPGTFPKTTGFLLYGLGVLLVLITTRGTGFFNLPFSLVNSFVDVLSYIRLFAVGLAGTYIAVNFDRMGVMLMNALPHHLWIVGIVLLVLVALFGHILNIALGFLSVMVHGVRLNTLEFSNHVGMQWAGVKFRPFAAPVFASDNHKQSKEQTK